MLLQPPPPPPPQQQKKLFCLVVPLLIQSTASSATALIKMAVHYTAVLSWASVILAGFFFATQVYGDEAATPRPQHDDFIDPGEGVGTIVDEHPVDKVYPSQTQAEFQLKRYLMDGGPHGPYKKDIRPQAAEEIYSNKSAQTTIVHFGFALRHIREVNERDQMVTLNAWVRMTWDDHRFEWNPDNYSNIASIRLPSSEIWIPDIILYNNFEVENIQHYAPTPAVLYHSGVVLWVPPASFKIYCQMDLRYYPFDVQTCNVKLGSWTHDGYAINLKFFENKPFMDLSDYDFNAAWDMGNHTAKITQRKYACCEEPYPDVTYTFTIRRHYSYYQDTMLIPCLLLIVMSTLVFWLPPDTREKMTFGMLTFLILSVFLIHVANQIPFSGGHVPLILRFYVFTMVMVCVSLFLAAVVTNMFHRAPYRKKVVRPVPSCVRTVVLNGIARVLCMHRDRYSTLDDRNKLDHDGAEMTGDDSTTEADGHNSFRAFVLEKQMQQSAEEAMIADWQLVAIVLDRVFFWVYLISITISIIIITSYE